MVLKLCGFSIDGSDVFLTFQQNEFAISRNTHVLVNHLLDHIPSEWHTHLDNITNDELNALPFGYIKDEWPASLKTFIQTIESLKSERSIPNAAVHGLNLPQDFFKGLSVKKRHEIIRLAPVIHTKCSEHNISVIIDIGAGLGYLPQLLFEKYGYNVLAIEADATKVETAIKRQHLLYNSSLNHVKYVQHFVDEESAEFLQNTLAQLTMIDSSSSVCLVGLHACADLTVTLLRLFSNMIGVHQALVMPCCYHRLRRVPGDTIIELFANFPVSNSLRKLYDSVDGGKFLTSAFLRLACQNTAAKWRGMSPEDHTRHSTAAMRRAILQKVTEEVGYHLSRTKRKTHGSSEHDDFNVYLDRLTLTHHLTDPKQPDQLQLITLETFRSKMQNAWKCYEKDCRLLEVFSAFQTSIQSICENVVLLDRVQMVKELGYACCTRQVTDDCISPRCYAIIANK
ncbi:uncharacterized protein CBL_20582 [Carabus blaptoides fortunei]